MQRCLLIVAGLTLNVSFILPFIRSCDEHDDDDEHDEDDEDEDKDEDEDEDEDDGGGGGDDDGAWMN
jgi:hypothetical protein